MLGGLSSHLEHRLLPGRPWLVKAFAYILFHLHYLGNGLWLWRHHQVISNEGLGREV